MPKMVFLFTTPKAGSINLVLSFLLNQEQVMLVLIQLVKKTIKKELNNSSADGIFVSVWTFDQTIGQLDECNGISIDGEYCYFVTNEYPYVGRCLKGVFTEAKPSGGRPGGNSQDGRPNRTPPGGNGGNRKPKGPSPEAHTHGDVYHTH
jgi:hypothetical protein